MLRLRLGLTLHQSALLYRLSSIYGNYTADYTGTLLSSLATRKKLTWVGVILIFPWRLKDCSEMSFWLWSSTRKFFVSMKSESTVGSNFVFETWAYLSSFCIFFGTTRWGAKQPFRWYSDIRKAVAFKYLNNLYSAHNLLLACAQFSVFFCWQNGYLTKVFEPCLCPPTSHRGRWTSICT